MYSTQGYSDQQPLTQPAGGPYSSGYDNRAGAGGLPAQGGYPPQGPYGQQGPYGNYPYPQQGGPQGGGTKGLPLNPDWSFAFFVAACSTMLGAFIGGLCLFFSFELVDFLEMCYILLFGGVLAVMDTPCLKTMKTVKDHREYFSKYVNILTRVTGKGIAFLFLGCSLFSTMWDNLESPGLEFLAFVLCMVPVVVGIGALVIGFIKSQKLNKARTALAQEAENVGALYDQHARTYSGPHGGLTMLEFSDLTFKIIGFKWEDSDLKLIFNALVSNPAWRTNATNFSPGFGQQQVEMAKIPREDLIGWVRGGMVWL
ncbi:unnamed protein product [Effrenium voratum]|uniref:Uncharacterized protein n=1 Tax=Effrenium voratum TaxID=2562239 RepID=A0AA36MYQ0_9DINO|nr:unnamed protein product [Effrenium voratum]CAJ1383523.1 unnamed protein product [Effrenium voratum]|mmetsp:Transcript_98212/g.233738  ORF Transcript_98212/g.233738 Transcript_98212/m.233738 type:complete len:313 (+) Transcript_98212:64-1002(+)